VLGPEDGLGRIRRRGIEALVFHAPRGTVEVVETPGWRRYEVR
jgi:hypothetical protein